MLTRRHFVLRGLGALGGWVIGGEVARRIEFLASHENRPYLVDVADSRLTLWASPGTWSYTLGLDQPADSPVCPHFTWREWLGREMVNPSNPKEVEDYMVDAGILYPEDGDVFSMPDLEASIPDSLLDHYIEWDYSIRESPGAQAFHYLSSLRLKNIDRPGADPLGDLLFEDGGMPGVNVHSVSASGPATLAGLQQRLLELGEKVQIRVG